MLCHLFPFHITIMTSIQFFQTLYMIISDLITVSRHDGSGSERNKSISSTCSLNMFNYFYRPLYVIPLIEVFLAIIFTLLSLPPQGNICLFFC